MTKRTPPTLVGLSLLRSDEVSALAQVLPSPEVVEVSLAGCEVRSIRTKASKVTVAAGFWYLLGAADSECQERLELLREFCQKSSTLACVVQLPPAHLLDIVSSRRIARISADWGLTAVCPLYFEPGKEGPPSWIDPSQCVWDPLWNPRGAKSNYWKIHGWHTERWVRLYPRSDLEWLAKRAARHSPQIIILGHSQRIMQLNPLMAALGR